MRNILRKFIKLYFVKQIFECLCYFPQSSLNYIYRHHKSLSSLYMRYLCAAKFSVRNCTSQIISRLLGRSCKTRAFDPIRLFSQFLTRISTSRYVSIFTWNFNQWGCDMLSVHTDRTGGGPCQCRRVGALYRIAGNQGQVHCTLRPPSFFSYLSRPSVLFDLELRKTWELSRRMNAEKCSRTISRVRTRVMIQHFEDCILFHHHGLVMTRMYAYINEVIVKISSGPYLKVNYKNKYTRPKNSLAFMIYD